MLDSCGNSGNVETPQGKARGGSTHARGKRASGAEINYRSLIEKAT
jgi:hypothetical protein